MPRGMIVTLWSGSALRQQHGEQRVAGLVDGRDLLLLVADDHRARARRPSGPCPWRTRSRPSRRPSGCSARRSAPPRSPGSRGRRRRSPACRARAPRGRRRRPAGSCLVCTARMPSRPFTSGRSTTMRRSKRPGRSSAGSSTSGRLVAATRMTPSLRLEAVHLDEQLVQRLLALVVAAAEAGAAVTADGVDLVDEDDAGRVLLALLEQVAHARWRRRRRTSRRSPSRRSRRTARSPRRRWRGRAASCRFPEGPSAARPWGCGRRASGTSAAPSGTR